MTVKRYYRVKDLIPAILPFSKPTLWRKIKAGEFPQAIHLSQRISAWKAEDIEIWLKNKEESSKSDN